jgi:hypothetical protein
MSKSKKYIVVMILVLVLGGIFVLYESHKNELSTQSQVEETASTTDSVGWLTYDDQKYHFKVDYFGDLKAHTSTSRNGVYSVSFNEDDGLGLWMSSVTVRPTTFSTPEEWVVSINKKITDDYRGTPQDPDMIPIILIDEHLIIEGYPAIATHSRNSEGIDYPVPDSVVFIKDGYLFEISDRTDGYEHTWNSFKFDK